MSTSSPPSSILIIGSGVFGLSTALALALRPAYAKTEITILDRSPEQGVFPSHDASSIDSSRIIRPDYADPAYSALAAAAHHHWRHSPLGEDGRYTESGMALIADAPPAHVKTRTQMDYVRDSYANVKRLAQRKECGIDAARLTELPSRRAIAELVGLNPADADTDTTPGDWGYLNGNSGWADAGRSMQWLLARVQATGRVRFVHGTATALLRSGDRVTGARLADASTLLAALVIVATGAWTGALVDLAGQAVATGQVLAYVDVTPTEAAALRHLPIVLNLSTGLFVIPPARGQLKVARHGYGYVNPRPTPAAALPTRPGARLPPTTSLPYTAVDDPALRIPAEAEADLRRVLRATVPLPQLHDRPFAAERICWYTDTPTGDFLVDYHPGWRGLFLATAGSGHGFKFLPIIGDHVVDCVEGRRPEAFDDKWRWRGVERRDDDVEQVYEHIVTEDGSRGGKLGLVLAEELTKNRRAKM
ncbi:putative fructosyl amino acid protein [Verticillium dahliae]|uniref:FAD dependent oxidoreductase domain-containing protein n=1 Tax=Verticillium dahliae TaxID=27337 RepID=A0AA45AP50_VERDA|nr:putative fructosyl amino acid protein [Verticillium dahliae]PNH33953.1 hypothetical protein BJF96_g2935 [Verticillium dahliae]